jgi:hypothetical protein
MFVERANEVDCEFIFTAVDSIIQFPREGKVSLVRLITQLACFQDLFEQDLI